MASRVVELIWLMLPAYAANMAAPFSRFWPFWNRPIDARLLGTHKTAVGFAFGVAGAIVVAWLQSAMTLISPRWDRAAWLLVGALFGFGALGGDALKSFFKRRRGLPPGTRWIPADQLDFVLGALLAISPIVPLQFSEIAAIVVISFTADVVVNQLAFRMRIRDSAW